MSASILCGVLSSFCLFFFFCVYVVLSAVVPMILQVVYFPVINFLAVDLPWSMEFSVEFLAWNL